MVAPRKPRPKGFPTQPPAAAPPAALLTHSPSPGLYSRLERAVEALPKEVALDGLENRLRKHPEGVAGWEMSPFLDNLFQSEESLGKTISRGQLLNHVHEASPAFTHTEKILQQAGPLVQNWGHHPGGKLGDGAVVDRPKYQSHREPDTENYREILLQQPDARRIRENPIGDQDTDWLDPWTGGHWGKHPNTIAHARIGDQGDALRIAEVQSDVRNQNVRQQSRGHPEMWDPNRFPLYDHYPEVLLKSILLKAAREGKRAIEIPDLAWLQQNTSMRPAGVQHVYGGQVPGTLIKAGRPLGGLIDEGPQPARQTHGGPHQDYKRFLEEGFGSLFGEQLAGIEQTLRPLYEAIGTPPARSFEEWLDQSMTGERRRTGHLASRDTRMDSPRQLLRTARQLDASSGGAAPREILAMLHRNALMQQSILGPPSPDGRQRINFAMPEVAAAMERQLSSFANARQVGDLMEQMERQSRAAVGTSRRLVIPDETRRRIIQNGIGLSILAPLLSDTLSGQPDQQQQNR